eukprot:GFKZ01002274.1.p1 GENE.GFKZ01002274.1~~GFKZ01002274.1.p1  ORF type:complete len:605 (+),score=108.76 GFKZ01002274.1:262-2076(+)
MSQAPLLPNPQPSASDRQLMERCAPIVEQLARAVTCPICLEPMREARQLKCGHFFCAECVVRMLAMENACCAVCKAKTTRRMIRDAPVQFDRIVESLRVLEKCISVAGVTEKRGEERGLMRDGFEGEEVSAAIGKVQEAALKRQSLFEKALKRRERDGGGKGTEEWGRTCYLCPKGVDEFSFEGKVKFGELTPVVTEGKKRKLFVHEQCALYSDGVYEIGGKFCNVERAVARCNKIVCGREACGRTRANVGCAAENCGKRWHHPCGLVEGGVLVEDGYKFYCAEHKDLAPKFDDGEFEKNMADPSGTETREHDEWCYLCGRGGRLVMCDTCSRVTHVACAKLDGIPSGEWSCGVCRGEESEEEKEEIEVVEVNKGKRRGVKRGRDATEKNEKGLTGRSKDAKRAKRGKKKMDGGVKVTVAHTGLEERQREEVGRMAKGKRSSVRGVVDQRVSHLVISAREVTERTKRTMKLCRAIAAGIPIVCWGWVEESKRRDGWAECEGFVHELTWDAEKEGRKLFEGRRFCFDGYDGGKERMDELVAIVKLGGGLVVGSSLEGGGKDRAETMFVREKNRSGGSSSRSQAPAGASVVAGTWILDECTKNRGE